MRSNFSASNRDFLMSHHIQSWLPKSKQESNTVTSLSLVLVTKKGAKIYYCYFFKLGDEKSSKNLLLILLYKLVTKKNARIYYCYFSKLGDEKRSKNLLLVLLYKLVTKKYARIYYCYFFKLGEEKGAKITTDSSIQVSHQKVL